MPKDMMIHRGRDFQAEDDQRTLMRAAEIMADKVRMRGAIRMNKKHEDAMVVLQKMLSSRKTSE